MGLYFLWSIGYQALIQSDFHKLNLKGEVKL